MAGYIRGWRWLDPDEAIPRVDVTGTNWTAWYQGAEQQRRAAVEAARRMAAQSSFFSSESEEDEEGDEFDSDSSEDDDGGVPMRLRYAVMAFNVRSEEDGGRFQWFTETIEGPLEVLPVQAEHRKGCELCDSRPAFGEVYFKYNVEDARTYSKLCEYCGMGVLHAALHCDAAAESEQEPSAAEQQQEEEEQRNEGSEEVVPAAAAPAGGRKGPGRGAKTAQQQRPKSGAAAAAAAPAKGRGSRQAAVAAAGGSQPRGKRGPPTPHKAAPTQPKKRRSAKGR